MPLIQIKTLPISEGVDVPKILKSVGDSISRELNWSQDRLSITWEYLQPGHYLSGGQISERLQQHFCQPIVYISCLEGKTREIEEKLMQSAVESLSRELCINPGNVSVILNIIASGRIYTNGTFLEVKK